MINHLCMVRNVFGYCSCSLIRLHAQACPTMMKRLPSSYSLMPRSHTLNLLHSTVPHPFIPPSYPSLPPIFLNLPTPPPPPSIPPHPPPPFPSPTQILWMLKGLDIFGNSPASLKKCVDCVCPNCSRTLGAQKFAPHLEKCMGMGRNSSRLANRK